MKQRTDAIAGWAKVGNINGDVCWIPTREIVAIEIVCSLRNPADQMPLEGTQWQARIWCRNGQAFYTGWNDYQTAMNWANALIKHSEEHRR